MKLMNKLNKWYTASRVARAIDIGSRIGVASAPFALEAALAENSVTITDNLNSCQNKIRLQRVTENSFGFIDLTGNGLDGENYYGEFDVRWGGPLKIGVEVNMGGDIEDLAKVIFFYSKTFGSLYTEARYSPFSTISLWDNAAHHLNLFVNVPYKGFTFSGWIDVNHHGDDQFTGLGELGVSYGVSENYDLTTIMRKLPHNNAEFSVGLTRSF